MSEILIVAKYSVVVSFRIQVELKRRVVLNFAVKSATVSGLCIYYIGVIVRVLKKPSITITCADFLHRCYYLPYSTTYYLQALLLPFFFLQSPVEISN